MNLNFFDVAYAQDRPCPSPPLPCLEPLSGTAFSSVSDLLLFIIGGLFFIAGALAVIYIIISGYQYITSAGDPDRAQKARNGLIYAVIGVVVIILAYALVNAVSATIRNRSAPASGGPGSGPGPRSPTSEINNPGRLPSGGGSGGPGGDRQPEEPGGRSIP